MAAGGFNTDMLSDETFDLPCTVCKNKGKTTAAVKYCTDCAEYYCLICVQIHHDVPLLKGHQILDQGKTKTGTRKQLPVVSTERCDKHGHKPVDMYCQIHDNAGCAACMAVEHSSCQDIFYITGFIQTDQTTPETLSTSKKLEYTEKALKSKLQNFQQEKQNILKRKAESIENVRKCRREVNERLDELEMNSIAEIEDKYEAVIQQIEDDIRVLQENKEDVTSARDALASADNNVSQVFVRTKKGQTATRRAEKSLEETKAGNQTEEIIFTADLKLPEVLEEMNSLGQVTLKYKSKSDLGSAQQVQQMDTLLQTKGMNRYSVKIPSDTDVSDIFSSCFLADGTVILADFNNNKLKRLDSYNYSVRDYYDLPESPWQVCSINNQEVAVSMWRQPKILILTTGNKLTKKSSMKVGFDCYGLAHSGNNFYISDRRKIVYMYTLSGQKLKQFKLYRLEYAIHGLAVSKDGSKIYAAVSTEGLIIIDSTGRVVKKFDDQMLQNAYDCNVTDIGMVLVCGSKSNNVLQFTFEGELIGEVVKSDGCQSVCCNQQMSKMIVCKSSKNEIEVYDLV